MGLASALNAPFAGLHSASLPGGDCFLSRQLRLIPPQRLTIRPNPHRRTISTLTLARRRNRSNPAPTTSSSLAKKNNKKKKLGRSVDEDEIDEDAIEALFAQLEEDLKKADPSLFDGEDDDEEISEEDLAKLDEELARVFDITDDDLDVDGEEEDEDEAEEDEDEDEEEEEEEEPVKLRNWQLRRLASALKIGRRKTNIKSLAAELCLDRAVVLEMLREPPPSLLMMAATLPDDEPSGPIITLTDTKTIEEETVVEETPRPDTSAKVPVHVKQQRLSSQKRIKKVDIQTLESVYRRSKRPTNTMIDSIVHVTNLPRKRIVKWFEDKRAEEGVPGERVPYQRAAPDDTIQ